MNESPSSAGLTAAEKEFLGKLAWAALKTAVNQETPPDPRELAEGTAFTLTPNLLEHRGTFVTLTAAGRLRGCIGTIEGRRPLVDAVIDSACSAAVADPRFVPVQAEELDSLELEISALTPLRPVSGYQDIEIGRHGIVLSKQGRRSVFLPQVATEQGWDLQTTLTQLALKAGLGPDNWQSDTEFQVFEAEVF